MYLRCALFLLTLHCVAQVVICVVPQINKIDATCSKKGMKVSVKFDVPFNGIIYSKGHYGDDSCRYVQAKSGRNSYQFSISLNRCGTIQTDARRDGSPGFKNVIIIQNDPEFQEVWDSARKISCDWVDRIDKYVTFAPFEVGMLGVQEVAFAGDTVDCWMEIKRGNGPFSPAVSGVVPIGEKLSIVIFIRDSDSTFDIHVKDCYAYDSPNYKEGDGKSIQLTDDRGCPIKEKLVQGFFRTRDVRNSGATIIAYGVINAFKFPEKMDVFIACNVEVCKGGCDNPCQPLVDNAGEGNDGQQQEQEPDKSGTKGGGGGGSTPEEEEPSDDGEDDSEEPEESDEPEEKGEDDESENEPKEDEEDTDAEAEEKEDDSEAEDKEEDDVDDEKEELTDREEKENETEEAEEKTEAESEKEDASDAEEEEKETEVEDTGSETADEKDDSDALDDSALAKEANESDEFDYGDYDDEEEKKRKRRKIEHHDKLKAKQVATTTTTTTTSTTKAPRRNLRKPVATRKPSRPLIIAIAPKQSRQKIKTTTTKAPKIISLIKPKPSRQSRIKPVSVSTTSKPKRTTTTKRSVRTSKLRKQAKRTTTPATTTTTTTTTTAKPTKESIRKKPKPSKRSNKPRSSSRPTRHIDRTASPSLRRETKIPFEPFNPKVAPIRLSIGSNQTPIQAIVSNPTKAPNTMTTARPASFTTERIITSTNPSPAIDFSKFDEFVVTERAPAPLEFGARIRAPRRIRSVVAPGENATMAMGYSISILSPVEDLEEPELEMWQKIKANQQSVCLSLVAFRATVALLAISGSVLVTALAMTIYWSISQRHSKSLYF